MIFDIKPYEQKILEIIQLAAEELNYPVYMVGGYVRDRLLKRPSTDLDIVCVGDGISLANQTASRIRPKPRVVVYKRFGTALIKHKELEIEFVGARKESYRFDSRKPDVTGGSLQDDQNRRDFTINALAVQINKTGFGDIIDPFHGLQDLEDKIIRTPLDPGKTFSDDPLRMMRAIRFATQLGFEIEATTYNALSQYKNRLRIVSFERISKELNKIIECDKPSIGFKMLFDTGILDIIFPELVKLQGVEVRNKIAHKDNFYHTLEVLDNISKNTNDIWLRWAAILHDIGKPASKRFNQTLGWTFHGHDAIGARMVPKIFRRLKLPLDHKMKFVQKLVRLHLRPISLTSEDISDSAVRRLLFEAGEDIDDLMTLCAADITSKNFKKVSRFLNNYERLKEKIFEIEEKDHLRNWQPPISGDEIMKIFGLRPSPQVGVIKSAIREAILDGHIANNHQDAYEFMVRKAGELGLDPV